MADAGVTSATEVLAVGKADDELAFPFPIVDDGTDERAPVFGVDRRTARGGATRRASSCPSTARS